MESEKTQLLTQNCQLKRLVDQNDNGSIQTVEVVQTVSQTNTSATGTTQQPHALKKRKLDTIYTVQVSDSSDEGLGSMSPEPTTVTLLSSAAAAGAGVASNPTTVVAGTAMISKQTSNGTVLNTKEFVDMKTMLEMERRKNAALEDRLRQLTECHQTTTTIYTNGERISYEPHEVIEHTDNLRHGNTVTTASPDERHSCVQTVLVDKMHHHNLQNVHVLSLDAIPSVGQTQVVMCTPVEHEEVEMVDAMSHMHRMQPDIDDDDSRTLSPCDLIHPKEELIMNSSRPQSPYASESHHMQQAHAMVAHKVSANTIRMQPILEAAIKAEPKVEVERIHSPGSMTVLKECNSDGIANSNGSAVNQNESRMFITHQNRSRQNLETIVEAIRRKLNVLFAFF